MKVNKYHIKNVLLACFWVVLGTASIVLLVAAVKRKDNNRCNGIEVNIRGVNNNFFIDKSDVLEVIKQHSQSKVVGGLMENFDLRKMEEDLEKEVWIKNAELYFDNNNTLNVNIDEREPIARVFTITGNSFYIDSSNMLLPLSNKFSARLPVFTGFTANQNGLTKSDSALLNGVKEMSLKIEADPFLMAMIDQVNMNEKHFFELIPKMGDQLILFGDATDMDAKFYKLKLFYKKVIEKVGWNKYSSINLQYNNQIVAKIKGKEDIAADSLRTIQLMTLMAERAEKMAADSQLMLKGKMDIENDKSNYDSSLIEHSIEREDDPGESSINETEPAPTTQLDAATPVKPVEKPVNLNPANKGKQQNKNEAIKKQIKKPVSQKALPGKVKKPIEKPKAVMPANDY
ncbi:MAG: FtsQ-type POTRA domain-containing protein [Niastella sp.]|nr:FtsQ-type POTRA domain-containing protein [Niastella sp.]